MDQKWIFPIIYEVRKSSLFPKPWLGFFFFSINFPPYSRLWNRDREGESERERARANGGGSESGGWGRELLRLVASVSHPDATERSRERERRVSLASDNRSRAEVYSGRRAQMVSRMVWFSFLQFKFRWGNLLNFGVNPESNSHELRFSKVYECNV